MSWISEFYPEIALFNMESTHGNSQYIVFTYSLVIVINRDINLEFLDYCLSIPKEDIHMIHKNMFVLISLVEMVVQCRILVIFYISFVMSLR